MSTQILIRLPDDLVAWIDAQVAAGNGSRAAVAKQALQRYRRQLEGERDARIYRESGGYADLAGLIEDSEPSPLD